MYYIRAFLLLTVSATLFAANFSFGVDYRDTRGNPPLLSERPVAAPTPPADDAPAETPRRYAPFRDHRSFPDSQTSGEIQIASTAGVANADSARSEPEPEPDARADGEDLGERDAAEESAAVKKRPAFMAAVAEKNKNAHAAAQNDSAAASRDVTGGNSDKPETGAAVEPPPPPEPPTPEGVEAYRLRLEERLLERYNNLPQYAGKVFQVSAVLTRPLEVSLDGKFIKAEFDQLVYDIWGRRIPALEKEYFVVTFGAGGALQVRSDPSIRVGLDFERSFSEQAPLAADPFSRVKDIEAFKPAARGEMPAWWRPEFPELF